MVKIIISKIRLPLRLIVRQSDFITALKCFVLPRALLRCTVLCPDICLFDASLPWFCSEMFPDFRMAGGNFVELCRRYLDRSWLFTGCGFCHYIGIINIVQIELIFAYMVDSSIRILVL